VGLPVHNEDQVASNVLAFLRGFYAKHPHYRPLPLYLFGESYVTNNIDSAQGQWTTERKRNTVFRWVLMSLCLVSLVCRYAGHYVPHIGARVVSENKHAHARDRINLQGIAIGTHTDTQTQTRSTDSQA
jgi:carboxypeptidase C (cathepsin A)